MCLSLRAILKMITFGSSESVSLSFLEPEVLRCASMGSSTEWEF